MLVTSRQTIVSAWAALLLLMLAQSAAPARAADYYLRPNGDDAATGLSTNAAWRSIDRVNRADLQPGDRVLFQAGQEFAGNLRLTEEDAGATNAPVVIGSFGEGRATLRAGSQTGISVENVGHIEIVNLVLLGSGRTNNTGSGIHCENRLKGFQMIDHLRVDNVEIAGFGRQGILVGGNQGGFRHVRISRCVLRDNLYSGISVEGRLPYDSKLYSHADVEISDCQAYGNTGDPNYLQNHSGSGILFYQVDGGSINRCAAWQNGALCRSWRGGGVGIWTCASRRVTIQGCESFSNKTSVADGGGFDIDGGSEECVLQYNYSHDNDGPGLMVYTYAYAPYTNRANIVRFNVSQNDSRKSPRYAGIWVRNDGDGMSGVEIYNNTVIVGPWTDQAVYVHGDGVEARFQNNIFVTSGKAIPIRVEKPHPKVRFENNLYWREGDSFQAKWGDQIFSSIDDWRAKTGAESVSGQPRGFWQTPGLRDHLVAPAPAQPQPLDLSRLKSFRPMPGSVALSGGTNLGGLFSAAKPERDCTGQALATTGPWPLGAFSQPGGN